MKRTLWRAAEDDFVRQGHSFSEDRAAAELYLNNPDFGGLLLFEVTVVCEPEQVLDLRGWSVDKFVKAYRHDRRLSHPGAIELCEFLPRFPSLLDMLHEEGFKWVIVDESYPRGSSTWQLLSDDPDDEPVLRLSPY